MRVYFRKVIAEYFGKQFSCIGKAELQHVVDLLQQKSSTHTLTGDTQKWSTSFEYFCHTALIALAASLGTLLFLQHPPKNDLIQSVAPPYSNERLVKRGLYEGKFSNYYTAYPFATFRGIVSYLTLCCICSRSSTRGSEGVLTKDIIEFIQDFGSVEPIFKILLLHV